MRRMSWFGGTPTKVVPDDEQQLQRVFEENFSALTMALMDMKEQFKTLKEEVSGRQDKSWHFWS